MKLRNKKTGEIKAFDEVMREAYKWNNYNSLAELNEEWEDYQEPKECWYIDWNGEVQHFKNWHFSFDEDIEQCKQIGNYFKTKEEAEKAVEKLKAWKRLKDKGFKFDGYTPDFEGFWAIYPNDTEGTWCLAEDEADLDLLFGGEDDKK